MTDSTTNLLDLSSLCLEIPPALLISAWHRSRSLATASSQWTAYLNEVCLQTILPWLQEDHDPAATSAPIASLASRWEFVTGTAVSVFDRRMVLIPTEAIDADDCRVPQEWVDVPEWAGDYYLAVQVNVDENWVRIVGFTTHRQLKEQGCYDWRDRTYCLAGTGLGSATLISDINALWVSYQLCPMEMTRAPLSPLPPLSLTQANAALQRLRNLAIDPRQELPIEQWGALIGHDGWRQRLAQQRQGGSDAFDLQQWLQAGISGLAQQFGWQAMNLQASAAGARGLETAMTTPVLARPLTLDQHPYELRVTPVDRAANVWRFELHSLVPGGQIPTGFELRLLTEDLQSFEGNADIATEPCDRLYLEVELAAGEGVVWEITPTPDSYEREILRF